MTTQPKTALITGITGQDGSYLAEFLLEIDVTRVLPLPNRNLDLTFENGFQGVAEMDRVVKSYE